MQTDLHAANPAMHDNAATRQVSGAGHRQVIAWLALLFTVALVVIFYLSLSRFVSADPLLMPLDDTYIHFQYARQFALGHPMVYNPGDAPSSGATSLLYPPLLAVGYGLGFNGWALACWALGIGVLCYFGAAWLVYLIALDNPFIPARRPGYALAMGLAFALSGPFIWAALSGMETALFLLVVLLNFYAMQRDRFRFAILSAALLPLIRPEGWILAAVSVVALGLRIPWPRTQAARIRRVFWLAVPLAAGLIQPLITLLATGTTASSGMLAKSHLTNTSVPLGHRLLKTFEFFGRMWAELLRGRSPDVGAYTSPILAEAALASLLIGVWLAWRARRLNMAVVALAWIAALTAAVATLDTAFWQFKRYQLPVMALFFPAAGWTAAVLGGIIEQRNLPRWSRWILPALILIPSAFTTLTFARNYAENILVIHGQQVPMARWVSENLPQEARVGVHDVGLVRYFGDRDLYDVVGLTTPGPARSWRQGPGALYEHMASSEYRPDYFAIYPDVQGLRYLLDAGVFGEVLAQFPVDLPPHNVAAATGVQVIYRADWSNTRTEEQIAQPTTLDYVRGMELVDQIDVANLDSEAAHGYRWWSPQEPPGFVTEVYRNPYHACALEGDGCWATDGGRVLTGGESFILHTRPGEDLLLVTRVHGRTSVPLKITINDRWQEQRVQPAVPGRWLEVVTYVPGERITGSQTRVRIVAQVADPSLDAYRPYYHWAYQGKFTPQEAEGTAPVATFGQDGAVWLLDDAIVQQPGQVDVMLLWLGPAPGTGDGVVFVHVYDNIDTDPVAQVVARPAGGVLPPGNWLPGLVHDSYRVTLPEDLPPGTYQVAVGLYDARSGVRYPVSGEGADPDRRLFIGEITVEE